MSISPIGTNQASSVSGVSNESHHGHGNRKVVMDAAAKALGMSTTDLKTALGKGDTLASLAQAKGVSTDSLTSAITSALTTANPSMSADRAGKIAARFIAGPGKDKDGDHDGAKPVTAAPAPLAFSGARGAGAASGDRDNDGDSR